VLYEQFRLCFKLSKNNSADIDESEFSKIDSYDYLESKDFIGVKTGYKYEYKPGVRGFERSGSYCELVKFLPRNDFLKSINSLVDD
jgi:hypothetical protein